MTDRLVSKIEQDGKVLELYEPDDRNPEVFVEGFQGVVISNQAVKINYFYSIPTQPSGDDNSNTEKRRVACRLVMSLDNFIATASLLQTIVQDIHKKVKEG